MKNEYEMTYKQYCEDWLENSRYKESYKNNSVMWNQQKTMLLSKWTEILKERAKVGAIPSPVLVSFIRVHGENYFFRLFRGEYNKGIQNFKIPKQFHVTE